MSFTGGFQKGNGSNSDSVTWGNVENKPASYPPSQHNHDSLYYRKNEIDGDHYKKADIDTNLSALEASLYKVMATANDEPNYLSSKVDNITLAVEGSELKVKGVDGLNIGSADINNWLNGTTGNIQSQIDGVKATLATVTAGMSYLGKFETFSDLGLVTTAENGDLAVVLVDENRNNGRSMYVYSEALGTWEFIGQFAFADDFIELKDTPNTYVGHNGKVVKVDGTNKKLVFDNVRYSDLENKPSSTVTEIDDAVSIKHEHSNKSLLDTYDQPNSYLVNAVEKAHTHTNKTSLDKLSVNANGELIIDGKVYAPKVTPQPKEYLYVRRTGSNQPLPLNTDLIFNSKVNGNIAYNTSTGEFTLNQGKLYRISVNPLINLKDWIKITVVDSATNEAPVEAGNDAIIDSVTLTLNESGNSGLELIIQPTSTRKFKVRVKSIASENDAQLRMAYSTLIIHEI